MKEFEKRIDRKKNNKGFSLVELIIVIAIMAILVGVVGTQVVPYIENSREAKDNQVLSSYCTAATSAYSTKVANLSSSTSTITITLSATATDPTAGSDEDKIFTELKKLTGYSAFTTLTGSMESKAGKDIKSIVITIDQSAKTISVTTTCNSSTYTGTFEAIKGKL